MAEIRSASSVKVEGRIRCEHYSKMVVSLHPTVEIVETSGDGPIEEHTRFVLEEVRQLLGYYLRKEVHFAAGDLEKPWMADLTPEHWANLDTTEVLEALGSPAKSRGRPPTDAAIWVRRALAVDGAGDPVSALVEHSGAERTNAKKWIRQMTGATRNLTDLEGEKLVFLEHTSGPKNRPVYSATSIAWMLGTLLP